MWNVNLSCFLMSYCVAFGLELARLMRRGKIHHGIMLTFAWAGLLAHTIYLLRASFEVSLPPLLSSTHDWMLVLAWLGIFLYVFVATLNRDVPVGLFVLPIVLLLIIAAVFASEDPSTLVADNARYRWILLHASLYVLGVGGVLIALVFGLMYVFQHRRLRNKQTSQTGLRLPSLENLARYNWWSVVLSVPLLISGLVAGIVVGQLFNKDARVFSFADPVVFFNSIVGVVMLAFLGWLVTTRRPAGKQVAWLTIWACGFMMVTLITTQLLSGRGVLNTFHSSVPLPLSQLTASQEVDR
jgi:ABC-type uncharacterized transport system permease subunit